MVLLVVLFEGEGDWFWRPDGVGFSVALDCSWDIMCAFAADCGWVSSFRSIACRERKSRL